MQLKAFTKLSSKYCFDFYQEQLIQAQDFLTFLYSYIHKASDQIFEKIN